jgi:P4 family phage/plasmid primase-like protien
MNFPRENKSLGEEYVTSSALIMFLEVKMFRDKYVRDYLNQINRGGTVEVSFAKPGEKSPFVYSYYYSELKPDLFVSLISKDLSFAVCPGIKMDKLVSNTIDSNKSVKRFTKDDMKPVVNLLTFDIDLKNQVLGFSEMAENEKKAVCKLIVEKNIERIKNSNYITAILYTGGGVHIQGFLKEAICEDDSSLYKDVYSKIQQKIKDEIFDSKYNFDSSCSNIARLFRLPLSKNMKYDNGGIKGEILFYEQGRFADELYLSTRENTKKQKISINNKKKNLKKTSTKKFRDWARSLNAKKGARSNTCTMLCREGLAQKVSIEVIKEEVLLFQKNVDDPRDRFDEKEALSILDNQVRYSKSQVFQKRVDLNDKLSALEASRMILSYWLSNGVRAIYTNGDYYLYNGKIYEKYSRDSFKSYLMGQLQDVEELNTFCTSKGLQNVLDNIKAEIILNVSPIENQPFQKQFDGKSTYLNLNNGILKISQLDDGIDLALLSHSSDYFMTKILKYDYNPDASCEKFKVILNEILDDKEKINLCQEMFGMAFNLNSLYEVFFALLGEGGNGKGVIRAIMGELIGEDKISSLPLGELTHKKPFNLASLYGKWINFPTETENVKHTDVETIKKIVSGEKVWADKKFKDPFEFFPFCTLIFSSNSIPSFNDESRAIWRRLKIIRLNQVISEEKKDVRLRDSNYWEKSNELSGILNWALEGLSRVLKNKGFTTPKGMYEEIENIKIVGNHISHFIELYLEEGTGRVSPSEIFDLYLDFCTDQGESPASQSYLTTKIKEKFKSVTQDQNPSIVKGKSKGRKKQRFLNGLRLKPDTEDLVRNTRNIENVINISNRNF